MAWIFNKYPYHVTGPDDEYKCKSIVYLYNDATDLPSHLKIESLDGQMKVIKLG